METFIIIWLIINVGAYIWWVMIKTNDGQELSLTFGKKKITGLAKAVVIGLVAMFFIPIVILTGEIG